MSALAKLTQAQRLAQRAAPIPAAANGRRRQQRTDEALRDVAALVDAAARAGCHRDGDNARLLEQRLRARLGVPAVVVVSSPGAAVRGVLELLRLAAGGEVIVPALGTVATPFAVSDTFAVDANGHFVKPGLLPVFVDVEPATYTLDPHAVEAAITDRTCAIVAAHLLGQPAEMRALRELASEHGLALIEDVGTGLGALYCDPLDGRAREAGALGDFGCLALADANGDASLVGAVAITQAALQRVPCAAARIRAWRQLGRDDADRPLARSWGVDARIDECAAAACLAELGSLDRCIARRVAIAERYTAALGDALCTSSTRPAGRHSFTGFVVRARSPRAADRLREHLGTAGIDTPDHVSLVCEHNAYGDGTLPCRVEPLDAAAALARTLVAVPAYPELTEIEIERVEHALETYIAP
jgi:dTDP-4-amino-4,6-dideoxygalactose transaminase